MQLIVVDDFPTSVTLLTYNANHIPLYDANFGIYYFLLSLFFLDLALDMGGYQTLTSSGALKVLTERAMATTMLSTDSTRYSNSRYWHFRENIIHKIDVA